MNWILIQRLLHSNSYLYTVFHRFLIDLYEKNNNFCDNSGKK